MKHVSLGDKSLLMGDDAADTLLEYARLVGDSDGADTVTLRAIGPDGSTAEVGILLNSSTSLVVESTHSDVVPPDNSEVVEDLRERMRAITRPASAQPEERWVESEYDNTDMI